MTYQLTVLYGTPQDPQAFDSHYEGTHAPLARQLPGLESYTSTRVDPAPDGTSPETYLVALLGFADKGAFAAAMATEQGQAAVADVATFASGGATMLTGETTTYA